MEQDKPPEILLDVLYADEGRLRSFYAQVFSGSFISRRGWPHRLPLHAGRGWGRRGLRVTEERSFYFAC